MYYYNEHALRLEDPKQYFKYRRTSGGIIYGSFKVSTKIDILWGHKKGEPKDVWHPQALRFPINSWTEKQAKDWIEKNIKNYISFDPAINKTKTNFSMNIMDNFRKLPIFKIVPLECDFTEIAITDNPAIEEYFLKFSNEEIKLEFNADKQIITGPVMTPNKLIYRNDALGERFVTYDEDGIRTAASLFMKNGLKFNSEHSANILPIEILESYFALEGNTFNVPVGSWIVSAKVNDSELWSKLKENNMGFSFQALFSNELIGTEQINFNKDEKMDLKEKLQAAINAVLFGEVKPVDTVETEVEMAADVVPAETVVTPSGDTKPVEETVQLTPELIQSMIDDSIMSATEEILKACKEMMTQGSTDTQTAMSAMSAKLEEFSKQPLSQPITETVVNTVKLTSGSDYSYLSGINK